MWPALATLRRFHPTPAGDIAHVDLLTLLLIILIILAVTGGLGYGGGVYRGPGIGLGGILLIILLILLLV